jgi:sugar phosphate isomerase/epimerase
MKFGYVLPDPVSYSWDEFENDLALMKELGYDAVEVQIVDPADANEDRLRKALDKVGFELMAFQTGISYYTQGNCLSSPDADVRKRTIDLLKRFIDFAQDFSSIIVFGSLQGRATDEPDHQKGLDRILAAMKTVGQYATDKNVVIAYEPVNHLETAYCNTIANVQEVVREFQLPGVQLMVDSFHMNIEEVSMVDCLSGIQDILRHVHLSETNRDVLGSGHWDTGVFLKKLREIGYDGGCSIGVFSTNRTRKECMRMCMDVVKQFK